MKKRNDVSWIVTVILAVSVVVISFTPIVIPQNIYKPMLFGLPYSLWVGLTVTVLMVGLTYIATRVHPGGKEAKKNEQLKRINND